MLSHDAQASHGRSNAAWLLMLSQHRIALKFYLSGGGLGAACGQNKGPACRAYLVHLSAC
jgi:hypothetical protein